MGFPPDPVCPTFLERYVALLETVSPCLPTIAVEVLLLALQTISMPLLLIQRAREDGVTFVLTPKITGLHQIAPTIPPSRIPSSAPGPGEQYRFHFDMTKCIGCKCCIVACNEQNGNPAAINWRRVGEIEGGSYPDTSRFYLSMGCNHCVEPSCLNGCPTDAYTKDALTGIVRHSADMCIGCQYCTWNCSYGVPQYNPERGVVGKCDMCYGRLSEGSAPACVNACPEVAIRIETVNIADWRMEYGLMANAPGLPSADDSLSTTRITLPLDMPHDISRVDSYRVKPEHPHWPLVFMTVLTQLSVFAFAAIWILGLLGKAGSLTNAAIASFAVAALALGSSTLHLGRPAFAWRALKMWRRSWLSREVLVFTLFAGVANAYAAQLFLKLPGDSMTGALTAILGLMGTACTTCIYLVPARPSWNTKYTPVEFHLTGAILGPLFVAAIGVSGSAWLYWAAAAAAGFQLLNQALRFFAAIRSDRFELQATAGLLSGALCNTLLWRSALLIVGGILLPVVSQTPRVAAAALVVALAGEILGRYLFFTSVVPKNMAASYHVAEAA